MAPRPVVLSPATPSELLSYIISYHQYPTTIVVGSTKTEFQQSLVEDITHLLTLQEKDPELASPCHPFLTASLSQIAISRHIRIIFAPTVTHLRAQLSVFTPEDSPISKPPNHVPSTRPPTLLVYGLLALHRDASEWSAQGIGNSAALLVDSASRNEFQAVVIEPKGVGGHDDIEHLGGEMVPLLNGTARRDDGSWSGRGVSVRQVMSRWFGFEDQKKDDI